MDGKNIACLSTGPGATQRNEKLKPLGGLTVRALLQEGDALLWAGGDFGVIRVDFRAADGTYCQTPRLHFRRITIDGDSLLFGGVYGREGLTGNHGGAATPTFGSQTQEITFRFSTDAATAQGETTYQYRLEGYDKDWSAWSAQTVKSYANLGFGTYTFQVRAKDAFGRCSDTIAYHFAIERPFYLRWYSLTAYVLLLLLLIWLAVKWRLRGLLKDKERLEALVASRTEQIRAQKSEIEKKSANLEQALSDLRHAQEDLVRQEKLATVGKLTRGLIDRILNPLNYINNFSHLSYGLANELRRNLAALKGRIGGEAYEDADDLLGMLSSNLSKIERHGGNTSRILKAMEEILKEHHRAKERVDLAALCRHSEELVNEYYRDEIVRMGITTRFRLPEGSLWIEGNEEQLGKILMSLISNSMYAIERKYGKQAYAPEISLTLEADGREARLTLKDNGTGIDPGIIDQVFDPFFTTKTTGEAAGVGLYLSREILLDHGGSITAKSEQGEYTEFTITIPII
ncbi:MAG TPA: response regulator receiver [Candidatus Bacteroides pullicola]|uniref:histidine kinase n=1 Tax=Candidatus Bacteroides pullicola TaxID=2838475 RepID=A0A9D1ZIC1_9BACE|nr:response regulator receiver [Candidatus Bacteroides pullicola]